MGKPTGFMDYKREVSKDVKPKDRIKNFNEFHEHLPREKQQLQGPSLRQILNHILSPFLRFSASGGPEPVLR